MEMFIHVIICRFMNLYYNCKYYHIVAHDLKFLIQTQLYMHRWKDATLAYFIFPLSSSTHAYTHSFHHFWGLGSI